MVLLVVDVQKLIVTEELYNYDEFIQNIVLLLQQARDNGVEVIYCQHDSGADSELTMGKDGYEIYNAFSPKGKERVFCKKVNSVFKESGLLEYLNNKNEKDIMIVGLQTDYCIDATVKCGFEHGLHMIVPENTNSTFDNDYMTGEQSYKYYNDKMWNGRYTECICMKDAIGKLQSVRRSIII